MDKATKKQALVKLANPIEGNDFIEYLEDKGFENVHNLTFENLRIKVLVVRKGEFFATNATCLAALANSGVRPISVNEFKYKFEQHLDNTNTL